MRSGKLIGKTNKEVLDGLSGVTKTSMGEKTKQASILPPPQVQEHPELAVESSEQKPPVSKKLAKKEKRRERDKQLQDMEFLSKHLQKTGLFCEAAAKFESRRNTDDRGNGIKTRSEIATDIISEF